MQEKRRSTPNWLILIFLLVISTVMICALTYLAGIIGILPPTSSIIETPFSVAAIVPLAGSPIAPYEQVDPAIIGVLDYAPSNYGSGEIDILSIQPVGIYLPRMDNVQLELLASTSLPRVLPSPTSLPLPLALLPSPTSPSLPLVPLPDIPTLEPNDERIVPNVYTGAECAPKGRPVAGILTQGFHRFHSGIDIAVPYNTPVIATHSGKVIFAGWSDIGYGYLVILQSERFITYYAHNNSVNVKENDLLGRGNILAWSGSSGNSSGPHVHFETRINDMPVDPLTFDVRAYESC
jgi:murein DD-endopeptidase MepM/ murein hydrolase activator NlpD